MKRRTIVLLSVFCLMLTACGENGGSSLPELPGNPPATTTAKQTETQTETSSETTASTAKTTTVRTTARTTSLTAASQYTSLTALSSTATVLTSGETVTSLTTTTKAPVTMGTTLTTTMLIPATTTYLDMGQRLADAEAEARRLQEELMQADGAVQSAREALNAAQNAADDAKKQAENYQNDHASEIALYSKGSQGFFSYVGADTALDVLANAEYADNTEIGNEDDATSLRNMAAAFVQMRKCNELRRAEGLDPLKVTDRMMAIAQSNLNWSDQYIRHSSQFDVGENLAWGYDDPFVGWYDGEKEDRGGHYKNIVNSQYQVTGFAVCTADRNGSYSISHGQVFAYSDEDTAYTVDEYEKRFNEYYNKVEAVRKELEAKKKAASDAQAAVTSQNLAVQQAEQKRKDAESAYARAEEALEALKNA